VSHILVCKTAIKSLQDLQEGLMAMGFPAAAIEVGENLEIKIWAGMRFPVDVKVDGAKVSMHRDFGFTKNNGVYELQMDDMDECVIKSRVREWGKTEIQEGQTFASRLGQWCSAVGAKRHLSKWAPSAEIEQQEDGKLRVSARRAW